MKSVAASLFLVSMLAGVGHAAGPAQGSASLASQGRCEASGAPANDMAVLLANGLRLSEVSMAEDGDAPRKYALRVCLPRLEGGPPATADGFNRAIQDLVEDDVDTFRLNVVDLAYPLGPDGPGSFLSVSYSVSTANSRVISLFAAVSGYIEGAAHPYAYRRGFTYDLAEARRLDLADLFEPGSAYLGRLADYSVAQLAPRLEGMFFTDGAEPRPENYENWNLEPDALVIQFNQYQVAPYVAGPQTVRVPYSALADILRDDDRLASVRRP